MSRMSPSTIRMTLKIAEIMNCKYPKADDWTLRPAARKPRASLAHSQRGPRSERSTTPGCRASRGPTSTVNAVSPSQGRRCGRMR